MSSVDVESRLPELDAILHMKSTKGRMLADLIKKITEISGIYRFQQRLKLPNVQELAQSEFGSFLDLLVLFSQGTFKDYISNVQRFPPLTERHIFNLRCLTLVNLAKDSLDQTISFSTIQRELGLVDDWQVFDFLIEALNYEYIEGKLDEPAKLLHVDGYCTRDLKAEDDNVIRTKLGSFMNRCDQTLTKIKSESQEMAKLQIDFDHQKTLVAAKIAELDHSSQNDDFSMPASNMLPGLNSKKTTLGKTSGTVKKSGR